VDFFNELSSSQGKRRSLTDDQKAKFTAKGSASSQSEATTKLTRHDNDTLSREDSNDPKIEEASTTSILGRD
jgi:hypothetical protein